MQGVITKGADIFSLGMTVLELASDLDMPSRGDAWQMLRSGQIPDEIFSGLLDSHFVRLYILNTCCSSTVSDDFRDIIKQMLHPDHTKRPTVDELLSLPIVLFHERKRKRQLLVKRYLSYLKAVYNLVCNSLKRSISYLPFYSYLTSYFSKPILDDVHSQLKEDSSPIIQSRSYVSNFYDQYSDDETTSPDVRNFSNYSLELSFEQEEEFNNNILR